MFKGHEFKTLDEYLTYKNTSKQELITPKYYAYDFTKGYKFILEAITTGKTIVIIGDYDVDGVTSTYNLTRIVKRLGGNVEQIIPYRMSDGYGISASVIKRIKNPKNSVVITVDNGIVAVEAVKLCHELGMKVMVTDHHLAGDILPEADVLYDAHVGGADYEDYCAAGQMYKFGEFIFGNCDFTKELAVVGAIGTVADMVPITGDNRQIVRYGLYLINSKDPAVPLSVRMMMEDTKQERITTETIGYSIAPMLNAPGRLLDDGAAISLHYLETTDMEQCRERLERIKSLNEERKELTNTLVTEIKNKVDAENLYIPDHPLVLYYPKVPEGIIGLIAGNLAPFYNVPAFIMSDSEGLIKGSARGNDMIHVKKALDACDEVLVKHGGHEGAGGFSLTKECLEEFTKRVREMPITIPEKYDYDIVTTVEEVPTWASALQELEPWGQDIELPKFLIKNFTCNNPWGSYYETFGQENEKKIRPHLTLITPKFKAKGFYLTQKYQDIGAPKSVNLIGNPKINYWNGTARTEFQIIDFSKTED